MPTPDPPTPDDRDDSAVVDAERLAEIVGGVPDPTEIDRIEAEERYASQRLATIAAGRRNGIRSRPIASPVRRC